MVCVVAVLCVLLAFFSSSDVRTGGRALTAVRACRPVTRTLPSLERLVCMYYYVRGGVFSVPGTDHACY